MENNAPRVAIVGLGALGLVTLKNLLEEGFDAVGFDSNDYFGGLWEFSEEDKTSVLPSTIINISKERGCFTDFPFPASIPSLCPATEVSKYLQSYADHFNLRPRMRLGAPVTKISRDDSKGKWLLDVRGSASEVFDKVVIATGMNQHPCIPTIKGIELFQGHCIHSRAFKRPQDFEGKDVFVLGLGNTGADVAVSLVGHARQVYISHRHGTYIFPRKRNGRCIDHTLTYRFMAIQKLLNWLCPNISALLFDAFGRKLQNDAFNIRPEWGLSDAPSLKNHVPVISDEIVPALESGAVKSVLGLKQVLGPHEIELDDGTRLEVDGIVMCTGYKNEMGLLEPRFDPRRNTTPEWLMAPGSRGKALPRLYQNVFSLDHPESLVFMGCAAYSTAAFQLYDVTSMAVAQVWKGNSPLPPRAEMERAVDEHHRWMCEIAQKSTVSPALVKAGEWSAWADRTAGTGVDEYLGWGWRGWWFWLTNYRLCNLLMAGVYSPHIYRIFEGKRKKWPGAVEEIERVNRSLAEKPKQD